MKTKTFLIGISFALLTACTTQRLTLDEITINDADKYLQFKNEQIKISTKDSVNVSILNKATEQRIPRKKKLIEQAVYNYKFSNDSLTVTDPSFRSVMELKTISNIKFKGIYDSYLGFVSENEINENIGSSLSPVGGGVLGGLLGGIAGAYFGHLIGAKEATSANSLNNAIESWISSSIIGTGLGIVLGAVIGSIITTPSPPKVEDVINDIREKKKIKNDQ